MGAQEDHKKVWFETASFWQLLKYFTKFALTIFFIGVAFGTIAVYMNLYQIIFNSLLSFCVANPWFPASLILGLLVVTIIHFKTKPKKSEVKKPKCVK